MQKLFTMNLRHIHNVFLGSGSIWGLHSDGRLPKNQHCDSVARRLCAEIPAVPYSWRQNQRQHLPHTPGKKHFHIYLMTPFYSVLKKRSFNFSHFVTFNHRLQCLFWGFYALGQKRIDAKWMENFIRFWSKLDLVQLNLLCFISH